MIRGLFRFVGMLLLAGAFVFLVYDGQRSIADQSLRVMKLGEFWNDMNQASQQSARAAIEALVPGLWDAVIRFVLEQPTWAVLGVFGLLLMLIFRPKKRLIGYARD
jgi:hypothetical protein